MKHASVLLVMGAAFLAASALHSKRDMRRTPEPVQPHAYFGETRRAAGNMASAVNDLQAANRQDGSGAGQSVGDLWIEVNRLKREGRNVRAIDRQADDWDLIIVDEAHRMSARDTEHKSERYRLGELLREKAAHFLLLTATPHKDDPTNFSLFLQLLDQEAYADMKSIHEAMDLREAACYLRRTKEVMLNFPMPQPDGTSKAGKLFKKRITHTVAFCLERAVSVAPRTLRV